MTIHRDLSFLHDVKTSRPKGSSKVCFGLMQRCKNKRAPGTFCFRVRPKGQRGLLHSNKPPQPDLARAEAFTRQLQTELAEVTRCQEVMTGIIGELAQ
jgi:hypothetical protein